MINELLLKTRQSYWNKVKVVLYLSNHATKKELSHATDVYTSDLAAKKILLLWNLKLTNYTLLNWLILWLV